jgi:hypothetical protein
VHQDRFINVIPTDQGPGRSGFVATDHKTTDILSESPSDSPIENELPTYRAISSRAVLSLICGVLAIFSFANPFFYLFALLAIVLGFSADRSIQRFSDVLTGRGLAKAGVALGLVFGLGTFTIASVQGFVRTRNAESFARYYGDTFKTGTLGDVLWLGMPPAQRKGMSPEEVMTKLKTSNKQDVSAYEMKANPIKNLKKRLASSQDQELHSVQIEREGAEGLTVIALALFEVHGPKSKEFPAEEEYALAFLKGTTQGGKGYEWWVDGFVYPY